jgi:signal transduction histidine kinase/ligand-binding sensor domain-containing protein
MLLCVGRSFHCQFIRLVCAAAFLSFLAVQISGQYHFDHWSTDNGLPQNSVGAIIQTRDGYLWLATLDGLVRFDGVKFKVFTRGNSPGIVNNRFRLLAETADGSLWVGTEEFGLTRYRAGSFQTFATNEGLLDNSPLALASDADGALLVVARDGIVKFDGQRFRRVESDKKPETRSCAARGGGLWLLDHDRLRRWRNGVTELSMATGAGPPVEITPVCYEDRGGGVWFTERFGEVAVSRSGAVTRYPTAGVLPPRAMISVVDEDRAGNLWLGTDAGLLRLTNGRFALFDEKEGLSDHRIISFFEDREGTIWLGTSLGGLNQLSRRAITVLTEKEGLSGNGVYPIFEEPDGTVWVGANGLTRIKDGVYTRFTDGFLDVTAIAKDSKSRLWIGGSGAVAYRQGETLTDLRDRFIFPAGSYSVWVIHEDHKGTIWFGTSRGLIRMEGENFTLITTAQGLADNDIKAIVEEPDGRMWLATYGGLSLMQGGKFQNFTTRDGLSSDRVRSLYRDADGTLWLGTYDGGLNRFRDGKFTVFNTQNGLFSDGVFQILSDDAGYLWMSSNQGIYRVRRQELEDLAAGKIRAVNSEAFGKRDGLLNSECNGGRQPSGIRARDGRLWFPTQEGVAVVDPKVVEKNPLPPPVVIESVIIDQKPAQLTDNIQVAYNQSNLEINYTGLSFVKPEQVRFRYRVEGLDQDWIEAGTRRAAYFSHLPPGSYTFQVMAANNSGVWSTEIASVRFTIRPPFWRTWWFWTLLVLLIVAGAVFVVNRRFVKLRRERSAQADFSRKLMAAQEQERQRIAGELHDDLGQNLLVIKNWALMAQREPTAASPINYLEEISGAASQTIDEVRRIAYNLRPYQIAEIGLSRALESMLKRLKESTEIELDWSVDPIDGLLAPENEINLFRIVQEGVTNIIKHSKASAATVTVTRTDAHISLTIEDDGRGFSADDVKERRGLGLTGIEERARIMGGEAKIQSAPNRGTVIRVEINA